MYKMKTKQFFDFDWICERCGECHLMHDVTGEDMIDPLAVRDVRKKLFQWRDGVRTYDRLVRLEAALQAHPDTHWKEIGGGHIRLYSTKDGHTVLEI